MLTAADGGSALPFWADAPVLEAIASPSPSPLLAALAAAPGWRVSGLRLADGPVVLKVEHGAAAVQLLIEDGFDPAGGIRVATPTDLRIPERLRRAADLWPAVAVDSKKKAAAASLRGSC